MTSNLLDVPSDLSRCHPPLPGNELPEPWGRFPFPSNSFCSQLICRLYINPLLFPYRCLCYFTQTLVLSICLFSVFRLLGLITSYPPEPVLLEIHTWCDTHPRRLLSMPRKSLYFVHIFMAVFPLKNPSNSSDCCCLGFFDFKIISKIIHSRHWLADSDRGVWVVTV